MATVVELVSGTDTITFLPAPTPENGWVYDNETLDAWYKMPTADPKLSKRPNAHGMYEPGQIFTKEGRPLVVGQYFGTSAADALVQRNRLNAFFADGHAVTMRVTDELGTTTRTVWVIEVDPRFHHDFSHFPFDVTLVAPDPRRYGPTVTDTDGIPSAGSGLVWNLGTAPSGLFFDWGTEGVLGRVEFKNEGSTTSFPRIEVGTGGAFNGGFRLTEIETGRELTFSRSTALGEVVVLDSRTERATIAMGDVTGALSSRDWFSVPSGQLRRYQITPLGGVVGNPTFTITAASADL